ncbi:hypothetical protein [Leifsonia poae]|uniref:hypothetical protein n=1 Tax=Leifsonia poae TaxID=110933 RepID=UPI001CBA8AD0|nr:hypothetical protein [Leifsonia poae]
MATKNTATVRAVTIDGPSTLEIVNAGIAQVIEATGIDVQKNRYKAMGAIAFQAFSEAIERDDFESLVDRALANVDSLPSGWEIERPVKVAPAKTTAAKKAAR